MTDPRAATASTAGWSWARLGHEIVGLPSRYRVSIGVILVPAAATLIARWALGDDSSAADIARLGYGLSALEDGRVWTLVTGAFVAKSLTISFVPTFSFVGVALLEHKARHWRAAIAFVAGQLLGVLLALLITMPLQGSSSAFAVEMTETVDFGFSVGGFAALGAWTAYLGASWRRPLRWGVSCYLLAQLLFSGLIYDVSHPIGWSLGVVGGTWLMRPAQLERRPLRGPADVAWIALGVVIGCAVGVITAWNAGGIGGIFGWGPSRS